MAAIEPKAWVLSKGYGINQKAVLLGVWHPSVPAWLNPTAIGRVDIRDFQGFPTVLLVPGSPSTISATCRATRRPEKMQSA